MLVIFLIGSAQHTMFEFDENELYTPFLLLCVLSVLPNLKFSCVPSIRDSSSSRTWWWLSNELIANEYLSLIGIVHFDHVTSMNIFLRPIMVCISLAQCFSLCIFVLVLSSTFCPNIKFILPFLLRFFFLLFVLLRITKKFENNSEISLLYMA